MVRNEQSCNNDSTLRVRRTGGDVAGYAGLTVRALRLVILDPEAGGDPGVEFIVSEALSPRGS